MSDDLTDRITELLKRLVRCGRTADRYLVGGEARPLLAEARDEITRLRAERTQMTGDMGTDLRMVYSYELGRDTTLAELAELVPDLTSTITPITHRPASLGDALNVGPDTTGEGT